MNEQLLRQYIRQQLQEKEHLDEQFMSMVANVLGKEAIQWAASAGIDAVKSAVESLFETGKSLQGAAETAIQEISDEQIRNLVMQQAHAGVGALQGALGPLKDEARSAIAAAVSGNEDLKDKFDEADIDGMAFLSVAASLAKVLVDFPSG